MSDILQRVENMLGDCAIGPMRTLKTGDLADVLYDAHEEIERLRAENERLREALATYSCRCGADERYNECYADALTLSCGRVARDALVEPGAPHD
jgi:hypothetical protein